MKLILFEYELLTLDNAGNTVKSLEMEGSYFVEPDITEEEELIQVEHMLEENFFHGENCKLMIKDLHIKGHQQIRFTSIYSRDAGTEPKRMDIS